MKFCRIDLSKTNYSDDLIPEWYYLISSQHHIDMCNAVYQKYCAHKKFSSVMPIFDSQYKDPQTDIIGYYDQNQLVAFSLVKKWNDENAEAMQFAWDYTNPELHFGINSLMVECAIYKSQGFKYLYLGQAADYKSKLDGYEILGPI